jgi:hypothetical protein
MEERRKVVRSLREIETDLKELFQEANEAAENATRSYYQKAAPLLIEAQEGHFKGNTAGFYAWAQKKFGKSTTSIRTYIAYGIRDGRKSFKNISEFVYTSKDKGGLGQKPRSLIDRPWTRPVDDIAQRAQREAFRLIQEEALSRAEEREAKRKLAHRLIDIGYRVLAKELHPDKLDGDKAAMQRLVEVRDTLKHCM